MATTCTTVKSNTFNVVSKELAENFFDRVASEDTVYYNIVFNESTNKWECDFASYGDIYGMYPKDEDFDDEHPDADWFYELNEYNFDQFLDELQEILEEDTVAKIVFNSEEKLRHVSSVGFSVTREAIDSKNIWDVL